MIYTARFAGTWALYLALPCISVVAQSGIAINGTVVDSSNSQAVANASVKLVEYPSVTATTDAQGRFTLGQATGAISEAHTAMKYVANVHGSSLDIVTKPNSRVIVDVTQANGARTYHAENLTGTSGELSFAKLLKPHVLQLVKITVDGVTTTIPSFGNQGSQAIVLSQPARSKAALGKIAAIYTVEVLASGYDPKQVSMSSLVGSAGTIRLSTSSQAPATWKNVTNPAMNLAGITDVWAGGLRRIWIDPVRKSDAYAFCDERGLWKSTDYGLTWNNINTGTNGANVTNGCPWGSGIDLNPNRNPAAPLVICCSAGYGTGGVWKSTDGGVNWSNVFTNNVYASDSVTNISASVGTDVSIVWMVDTSDCNHLIAHLHNDNNGNGSYLFESTDGGVKWIGHLTQFDFGAHTDRFFWLDKKTWFVSHKLDETSGSIYRSTDGGVSWTQETTPAGFPHDAGNSVCLVGSTMYVGTSQQSGFWKSSDRGTSWASVSSVLYQAMWITATPTNLYASCGFNSEQPTIFHASVTNDAVWTGTKPPAAMDHNGESSPAVTFDGSHYILLAGQDKAGIWRYVEP